MAQYEFTSICDGFKQAHKQLTDNKRVPTEDEKKNHDQQLYAALMPSFSAVKEFYKGYEKTLAFLKEQAKSNTDAIEGTLKKSKGKPSETELKLIKDSQTLVIKAGQALKKIQEDIRKDLLDWRGPWDGACAGVAFNHKPLQTILAYRKGIIDQQAREWNPAAERIEQYVIRVNTLVEAALKASGKGGSQDSGADLERLTQAHKDCMDAGAKGLRSLAQTVAVDADKLKKEAKDGLPPNVVNNAASVWKAREGKYSQYEAYAKAFSGADKTLGMLLKAVADGAKTAAKGTEADWKKLKSDIEADIKLIGTADKHCAECIKYAAKVAELYKKAIRG